jgi:hypothetical protein
VSDVADTDVVEQVDDGDAHCASPTAVELLDQGVGFLTRSRLRELGLGRRAVDAVFRNVPNVIIPGYSYPVIRVEDFLRYMEGWTYRDDRVYPSR